MLKGHSTRKISIRIVLLKINLFYFNSIPLPLLAKIILHFEFISCLELFQSALLSINISGNFIYTIFYTGDF